MFILSVIGDDEVPVVAAALYDWLLFLHIVASMVWVGGAVVLGVVATAVLRSRDADAVARFVTGLKWLGPRVLAPATIAVVALGVWMVLDSEAWDFGQTWVVLALALFAAAFLIGAVYQSRTAIGADRALERGDHDEALRQLARWSWGYGAILLLLLVAAWDMVFKPGL
jgi:uncharacterized membrane protein